MNTSGVAINKTIASATSGQSKIEFMKEPARYMVEVYKNYHNRNIDDGIKMAKSAIDIIKDVYNKDPNTEINDPDLKLKKAYHIKSTLHTLLGMLYYRKSRMVSGELEDKIFAPILERLYQGKGITRKDLDIIDRKLSEDSASTLRKRYIDHTLREFKTAIDVDPSNPSAHYQLGTLYSALSVAGHTEEAEREFYLAVKLSYLESDMQAVARTVETLKSINPESDYLKKIDELIKEKKYKKG